MAIPKISFSATINGQKIGPVDLPEDLMAVELLQEYLNLTGTRLTCGQGVCRACTIIIDGEDGSSTVPACITGIAWLNGRTIRTIEGIAGKDTDGRPVPSPVPLVVKNGSKMRPSTASLMPQPVSRTVSRR